MAHAVAWGLGLSAVAGVVAGAALARGPTPSPAAVAPSRDLAAFVASIEHDAPLPGVDTEVGPTAARVIDGPMEVVLYGDGAHEPAMAKGLRLLGHRLDLTRDVALGDRVRLVARADGRVDYVELSGARASIRLYRLPADDGTQDRFVDADGVDLARSLLRTPLERTRITSAFGPRRHPLLGYTRMHRGVDFGAPMGTPVLAAADGVVETAGWAGGYGRRIRLRHADGLETLYGHLSEWNVRAGQAVRQGQVIGLSGSSGLATGPHLHFEVLRGSQPVDPGEARPSSPPLSSTERAALDDRKRAMALLLARRN
ncbi:peptidoglycan DD-metalloendopeptidase family protein [Caulobacter sp. CCNWLY153]|uniref:M23 family metallopeptidase n=1 Tax=unclassified Caulobacter TaxID=2648921 RepID=UPI002FF23004